MSKSLLTYLFCVAFSLMLQGQNTITVSGKVLGAAEKKPVSGVLVTLQNKTSTTNENGLFSFDSITAGKSVITFVKESIGSVSRKTNLTEASQNLVFVLGLNNVQLEEVFVESKSTTLGELNRLKPIEGVLISQGKKNEVIQLNQVLTNKATNQSRQIYARIPGLNIWESDGSGLQLGIGGRGLDPNRTSNFNTRQNGYDISADALGYPESYYTPPSEAVEKIQFIRGAASLQFGTQFGGLLNFVLKDGPSKDKDFEATFRKTAGSFGLDATFLSLAQQTKKTKYYAFFQRKIGDDFRPNSHFDVTTGGIYLTQKLSEKTSLKLEYTKMRYFAQQPGGLTDYQFQTTPFESFRNRNWFAVDWNLGAVSLNTNFNSTTRLNSRFFGLNASRKALGFLGQINRTDPLTERDLIWGEFKNFGNETRFLKLYDVNDNVWALLLGGRAYYGNNLSVQGFANSENGADFSYVDGEESYRSNYQFPSANYALFAEHIFNLGKKLSITPGLRFEYINTTANGWYKNEVVDLAGNVVFSEQLEDMRENQRSFVIGGIGVNYKMSDSIQLYGNISQNYRSINFTDMQIRNPNFRIDPNLQDEKGFNADIGLRGSIGNVLNYDVSAFALYYNNRIGTTLRVDSALFNTYQYRTNVAASLSRGIEFFAEMSLLELLKTPPKHLKINAFANASLIDAQYIATDEAAFEGKKVEFVPPFSIKTGLSIAYKDVKTALQYSYTKEHFSDATNAEFIPNAVVGLIPTYTVVDWSMAYQYKQIGFEAGITNLLNARYFTRRAKGYPGPGIIPSPPRQVFFTFVVNI